MRLNKEILRLAIPSIITNITVPLLGMVDVAIIGHISDARGIAAIALGTMIFNLVYWNFGFLRMGTSGLTAQAYGAQDRQEYLNVLVQGLAIAGMVAVTLIALQYPIGELSRRLIRSSEETIRMTLTYFFIRIWAAPATLGLYVLKGWFIGMQNAKTPMWIAIALNLVNIVCSLLFVYVFDFGIAGIAWGTVIAQYSGFTAAVIIWFVQYGELWKHIRWRDSIQWHKMVRFFKVNADIFLRSLCLIAVFTFIPYISGDMGDEILAANTLLLQLFTLLSYIMDGFAYAGESLVGRYIGARDSRSLHLSVRLLLLWGLALTVLFTVLYAIGGDWFLRLFSNDPTIIGGAQSYMFWTLIIPVCGFAAFLFDGIFVGATASRAMRDCMFVATLAFFAVYFLGTRLTIGNATVTPQIQVMWNNILWTAFVTYLALRGILQALCLKKSVYNIIDNK